MFAAHTHDHGAVRRQLSAAHRACDHSRQIEDANALERTLTHGDGLWSRIADPLDLEEGQGG